MILFKTSREDLFFPSISFTGIFQEHLSLPPEQPLSKTPLMSLSPSSESITYWFKASLQNILLINCFKEIFTKDFGGVIFKNIFSLIILTLGFRNYGIVSCIAILAIVFKGKFTLPNEFVYVFKRYS